MKTEAEQIAGLVAALQSVPSPFRFPTQEAYAEAWYEWLSARAIALMHAGASYDIQCSPSQIAAE